MRERSALATACPRRISLIWFWVSPTLCRKNRSRFLDWDKAGKHAPAIRTSTAKTCAAGGMAAPTPDLAFTGDFPRFFCTILRIQNAHDLGHRKALKKDT